jgi:hypothetical protein
VALTPSQRIQFIKGVGQRLATEEWTLIDLTLKQFSLPWSDGWGGSKESYLFEMISEASDESLIGLAVHVGLPVEEPTPRIEPPFWRAGMLRVFVSHLAVHRTFAAELQEAAESFGLSCFVAHNDIEPTAEWQTQIETALATCDCLVALLHPTFHASNWTDQEIGFAMGRALPTFSVRFGQDPYGFIGRFQAFNGTGKTAAALADELFDSYRRNKQTQRKMAEVIVGLFEKSTSFATAKKLIGLVESLEIWEPSFSARLESAVKNNSQVNGSWGVPERANALVKKWGKSGV